MFQRFAGRELGMDEAVYRSESATGHRNRAIAFLELNSGMIGGDVDEHLDLYFRQCSLLVNTVDLAIIGATLANGGINPLTGERALAAEHVRSVLSVMNTCGMYDYAGGWQFDVGLPAKSGVGGGITAVLPGHLGIGVFSPRLDAVGNSERGVKVCQDVSRSFRLHLFEDRGPGSDPVRRFYRGTEVRSSRMRRPAEMAALDHDGHAIAVCELQGELTFVEAEKVSRRIGAEAPSLLYVILDMSRLRRIHPIAFEILQMLRATLEATGRVLAIASPDTTTRAIGGANGYPTVDAALEHFEDALLARVLQSEPAPSGSVPLKDFVLLSSWTDTSIEALARHLKSRRFVTGEVLIETGTKARSLYFLTEGRVHVAIPVGNGTSRRVSTIDAGNVFGELALFGQGKRTADIVADCDGCALELGTDDLAAFGATAPEQQLALALAVGRSLADRLGRANREIQALSR
jgi:glutaminase